MLNKMADFLSLVKGITPGKPVCPKEISDGLIVSTVFTRDLGYETAIFDKEKVTLVQIYKTREEAENGHEKWAIWCQKNIDEVTKLGYKNLVPEKKVSLIRMSEEEVRELYDSLNK